MADSDLPQPEQAEALLAERLRLASLTSDVAAILIRPLSLAETLSQCTDLLVQHLDAAFARIWTLNEREQVLELQASSGMYTHLDGPHARIPVGKLKIGLIAQERLPHLTNAVVGDPRVSDQAWAAREGMVAFAGYPLLVEDRLVGVMALFARRPHSPATLGAMASVANGIALGIERRRTEDALAESEQRLRTIFAHAAIGIAITDRDGRFLAANPAYCRLTGYTADELAKVDNLSITHPDDRANNTRLVQELMTGELPGFTLESRYLRKDGGIVWGQNSVSLVRDSWGEPQHIIALTEDISARKHAESELEQLLEREQRARTEAEAALRLRDELVGFVAHDLRTPITSIRGYTQLLQRRAMRLNQVEEEPLVRGLVSIDAATRRLEQLVAELLDTARLQVGEPLELNRTRIDLVALSQQAAREFQQRTDRHTIEVDAEVATVFGEWDAPRLERVMANLLGNAVKYSPNGGTIAVSVAEQQDERETTAVITVRDAGIGIPEADLPYVFERFRRGSNVIGSIEGMGIGLAGAKQIVEQHGGTISVSNLEEGGSAFTVRLPFS